MRFTGGSEFLVYGLLFLAIVGFNLFKQFTRARRDQARRQQPSAQNETAGARQRPGARRPEPLEEPQTQEVEMAETHWGRAPEPAPVAAPAPAPGPAQPLEVVLAKEMLEQWRDEQGAAPAQPPVRRRDRSAGSGAGRRLLRHRGDLRHGIVLMTVLGPCRALQPYDQDHH